MAVNSSPRRVSPAGLAVPFHQIRIKMRGTDQTLRRVRPDVRNGTPRVRYSCAIPAPLNPRECQYLLSVLREWHPPDAWEDFAVKPGFEHGHVSTGHIRPGVICGFGTDKFRIRHQLFKRHGRHGFARRSSSVKGKELGDCLVRRFRIHTEASAAGLWRIALRNSPRAGGDTSSEEICVAPAIDRTRSRCRDRRRRPQYFPAPSAERASCRAGRYLPERRGSSKNRPHSRGNSAGHQHYAVTGESLPVETGIVIVAVRTAAAGNPEHEPGTLSPPERASRCSDADSRRLPSRRRAHPGKPEEECPQASRPPPCRSRHRQIPERPAAAPHIGVLSAGYPPEKHARR